MRINLRKVGVFFGDGDKYDYLRGPGDPLRIGSILYESMLVETPLLAEGGEMPDTISNE